MTLPYGEHTFFCLVQTSRQLRHEFLPLWIRNPWWLLDDFQRFSSFMEDFYPIARDYCSAPRQFRIEWQNLPTKHMPYGSIDNKDFDITSLLRLRASRPSLHIDFVFNPDFFYDPFWRTCQNCDAPMKTLLSRDRETKRCGNRRHKIDQATRDIIKDLYKVIKPLNKLLAQIQGPWMAALRKYTATQQFSVSFGVDLESQLLRIPNDFHPRSASEKDRFVEFASCWLEKHGFRTHWDLLAECDEVQEAGTLRGVEIMGSISFRN